jgi:GMP synthase (glutamine-hydrolysing)
LIVKTGTALPGVRARRGDYERWILDGLALESVPFEVVSVYEGDALPDPTQLAGVILTGSAAMVTDREEWSERTATWLPGAVFSEIPILGICYGHQLLAHAFGGEVGRNPRGREMGTVEIDFSAARQDPLLGGVGERAQFQATHVESVLALPPRAVCLAGNAADPHHAFRLGTAKARVWGIQFHPEFDQDVIRGYIETRREVLGEEGLDADEMISAARETPAGPRLLKRFGELVAGERSTRARPSVSARIPRSGIKKNV